MRIVQSTALAIFLLTAVTPGVLAQETTAIVGGTLIDGRGGPPVVDSALVIRGNRIVAVGPRAEVMIPKEARVVQATGKFLTPGLIDNNVHLVLPISVEFFIKYEDQFEEIAIQSAQIALKYGMTTVRDSWGPLEPLLRARARLNSGQVLGSRLLVAGNIVGTGGPFSEYFLPREQYQYIPLHVRQRINAMWEENVGPTLQGLRPPEVRQEFRKYLARGVDFVKVAVSAHRLQWDSGAEPLVYSPDVLKAMAEEVHAAGKIIESHTSTRESLRLAVEAGFDLLQHPRLDERDADLIALVKEKNVFAAILTPKNSGRTYPLVPPPGFRPYPSTRQTPYRDAMIAGGVRVAMATDAGPQAWELGDHVRTEIIGRKHFEAMEDYQDAGLTPMQVLIASTRTGAEACQMEKDLGTLEVGKIADLLVLSADPSQTIANVRKIDQVWKDGKLVDRSRLPEKPVLKFDPELTYQEWLKNQTRSTSSAHER
jgi:imidazolonepropionase-like amidohydrolase